MKVNGRVHVKSQDYKIVDDHPVLRRGGAKPLDKRIAFFFAPLIIIDEMHRGQRNGASHANQL